jgi:murein L,D-transpeptidase YcbB/YkuD
MSGHIFETLLNLSPSHADYYNLKKALATYRRLEEEGGWESFNTSLPKLQKGMRNPDIALLRKRIAVTEGFIASDTIDADYFDQTLHDRVKLFQQKNSLTVDGIVGKSTIEALNIPVEERIATIIANLERWRWINDNLGERYIRVNIANFGLQVMEGDTQVFSSLAIVGKLYRETPVFSSVMRYLVLNPVWTVPETILKEDIIPAMIKNPEYLAEKKMKVFHTNGTEVDPLTIDWNNARYFDN